ncbi:EamA family transporter [Lichenihabitans sp. Uapishka_5]|uniref:aromatic amino acid exporter YddG n=1 Tax=Lichenihabitans sp. Uapishka_5 TaxID=3037302 RepID=UPI0029E7DA28|nr:EamA family transporter [Lichenihabitans sp. Uapishka_5]MDX7951932.1 EamA family transporter [Lichenihabitans sp. Uapishka_5]
MLATVIGFTAVLLWSCLALLTTATGTIPPFELAALTFAIGGTLGVSVTAMRGRLGALRQPLPVWAVGVGGLFGYHALYFAALRQAPPAQAGLIAYLWPLLIVLLSAALPGERLAPRHIVGALLGFAGVIVLIGSKQEGATAFAADHLLGYGLAAACALVWSSYSVLSRQLRAVPTDAVGGFCLMTALLAAVAHGIWEPTVWPETPSQTAAIVALGLGPVGVAFYVWDHGVKRGDIRLLGVVSYAAPVLSTLILVACGIARPTWTLGVACLMIVAGAVVASVKRSPRNTVTPMTAAETQ